MRRFTSAIRHFFSESRGSISVEAVIMLPFMAWTFMFFSVMWDGFRAENLARKATFTIADVISREITVIEPNYARTYVRLFNYAAEIPGNPNVTNYSTSAAAVRVTAVSFSEGEEPGDEGTFNVSWSMSSDTVRLPLHSNTSLQGIAGNIPALVDGDSIIVVETRVRWQPRLTAAASRDVSGESTTPWMMQRDINTITTVRPRFVPKLCYRSNLVGSPFPNVACEL